MKARVPRCVALAVLVATGCSEPDGIRVLDEPKPTRPAAPQVPEDQKPFRTLAAMFPRDDPASLQAKDPAGSWWFFKLSGPAAAVAKYAADFDKLIDSVRFPQDEVEPITWTTPEGWKREAGSGMGMAKRFATIKSPGGEVEVSVTTLGGVVLNTVQRWWGQLWGPEKQGEVTAINLPDFARQRMVNGRFVLTVDLSGPRDPNAKAPNPAGPVANPHNPHGG